MAQFTIPKIDTGRSQFTSLQPRKKKTQRDTFQSTVASVGAGQQSRIPETPEVPETPVGNASATDPKTKFVNNIADTTAPRADTPITGTATTPSGAQVDVATGGLTQERPDRQKQRFEDAQAQFIRSITPGAEEIQAQANLQKLITESGEARAKARLSGETLGFARGREAQVIGATERTIGTQARGLEALTGQRVATGEAAQARAEFEKDLLPEAPEAPKPFTLAPGQIRFDAQGQPIATGGARPASDAEVQRSIDASTASDEAKSSASGTVSAISEILSLEDDLGAISGAVRTTIGNKELANRMLSLQSQLTLPNLDKLKGSMSDKDLEFVKSAASVINPSIDEKGKSNLPTEVLIQELRNIRGMFQLQAGVTPTVTVFDPSDGSAESFTNATRAEVDNWFAQGLLVDFQ